MEKEFFLNTGIPGSLQFYDPFSSSTMPTWQALSSAMELQSPDCFLSTATPTSTNDNFESALSSMVSSPAASNPALSNDNLMIRELIGKLGNIGSGGGNRSASNSCYSTPLSSPPKMGVSLSNVDLLGNSAGFRSNLPAMPGDPGFAERAARFSSFGSRSFNGRTSQYIVNNNHKSHNCSNDSNIEFIHRSNSKLTRVLSSPSLLKEVENQGDEKLMNQRKQAEMCGNHHAELSNSRENSSLSGQNPAPENGSNKKRKAPAPKGKTKETLPQSPLHTNKVSQNGEDSTAKRSKSEEGGVSKTEENRGDANQKPPEAPKDYIHVRARRGQATDSHSLAERVRREKISERMKLLQDLVPGCDKVTGKALMLDEIINYVQSLQRQVEFLSMKLSSVNPRLEFNVGNLFSKDVIQPNNSLPHPMYPLDSLAPSLYGQPHQNHPLQDSITTTAPSSMDPSHNQNHPLHLHSLDAFSNGLPQLPSLCEGDLQSIVQMSYGQKENGFQQQQHGSNPSPLMKIEF